ncbi:MAG: glycogen synthase GlgA [Verrucomicrobia bacterium]|nr:glycogen synthase GlgA [Verrucomicrobiota bacterium]
MPPLKILFVSPEVEPFVKVGGLADMVGSLPRALAALGHDVRIVMPAYGCLRLDSAWHARPDSLGVDVGTSAHWARTWETVLPGSKVPVYALEHEALFGRPEVYASPWGNHPDNDLRFAFLCRGALNLCLQLNWIPDVIHGHDWTTGLLPLLLNTTLRHTPLGQTASVFTIHNLEHQGYADKRVLDFAHIPPGEFRPDSTESVGAVNMMKAGLYHATKLTTVSPTYADEIKTPAGGFGLDHVLRFRAADLVGILNGIDDTAWNPAMDKHLPRPYDQRSIGPGKAAAKLALQRRLGLAEDPHIALFGIVSRFANQKGLDLLAEALPHIVPRMHVQFAFLGAGDPGLEQTFRWATQAFPGRVGLHVGYDNALAHLIQAGSDFFVMPSRAEPCGLTQMYAMRYGTPPLVRSTGGLIDTVDQYVADKATGTGFRFQDATAAALYNTIGWACATYYDRPDDIQALRKRGMDKDFSWGQSARSYEALYGWAVAARRAPVAPIEITPPTAPTAL